MRVVVTGSKNLAVDISKYLPNETEEIVCGDNGGVGIKTKEYADKHNIPCLVLKSHYENLRNKKETDTIRTMIDISDYAVIIWDGKSEQTRKTIEYCATIGKQYELKIISNSLKTA